MAALRVHVVDPSAYTPPYDHALCAALARAGARPTLVTSRFAYGAVPAPEGYELREAFYRSAPGSAGSAVRRAAKLASHVPDMLRERRAAEREADVAHFQWLSVQSLDARLLPRKVPVVLTAHDVLPREPRRGQREAQRRLYDRVDAVVVHSEHGRERLTRELGVDPAKVTVIPHGVFVHLLRTGPGRLPAELGQTDRPVVLMFGLIRPYKGLDVLLEAWRGIDDAELWVVGLPKMDMTELKASAPPGVRFVDRFVGDEEIRPLFERADLVVLPYREIDQSGVLFTALAFGRPLLLSAVGGFPEIAAEGAAETVPPDDPHALREALRRLLIDGEARERLVAGARAIAEGAWSWDAVAREHLALYERLPAR